MEHDLILQTVEMIKNYHKFFVALIPFVFMINLWNLFMQKNYAILNKRIWYCMPLLYALFGISFVLGTCIWAMQRFYFSLSIGVMWVILFVGIFAEIRRNKSLKTMRLSKDLMQCYVRYCKIYYGVGIFVCLVPWWL